MKKYTQGLILLHYTHFLLLLLTVAGNKAYSCNRFSFILNVDTATITINTQPVDQAVCENSGALFSIAAIDSSNDYQWQLSTDNGTSWTDLNNGGNYSGVDSDSLTVSSVSFAMNSYLYHCLISTDFANAISDSAMLNVESPITISNSPPLITSCAGNVLQLTPTITGTNPVFQWMYSSDGGNSWQNAQNGIYYSGVNTPVLTIDPVSLTQDGYLFHLAASNLCGTETGTDIELNVLAAQIITSHPADRFVCENSPTIFSVAISPGNLTCQWQVFEVGAPSWVNITNGATYSNVTTTALTLNATILPMNNNLYRCVVTSPCVTETSSGGELFISEDFAITQEPVSSDRCEGESAQFSVSTFGASVLYQWQENTGTGFINISNGGIYSGAQSSTLTLDSVTPFISGYEYRCHISNGDCPDQNSDIVGLVVYPMPNPVVDLSGSLLSCSPAFATYQWYMDGNIIGGANSQNYTATVYGYYSVLVTDSNGCQKLSPELLVEILSTSAQSSSDILVYPVPANDFSWVNFNETRFQDFKIELIDLSGKTILGPIQSDSPLMKIDLSGISSGMYLLKVESEKEKLLYRLPVQK